MLAASTVRPASRVQQAGCGGAARRAVKCPLTRQLQQHAWSTRPEVFLSAQGREHPQKASGAAFALALEALSIDLKRAAAFLLERVEQPKNKTLALEATLRSALQHCALVSKEEVLPCVRSFVARSGAAPKEWALALRRGRGGCQVAPIENPRVAEPAEIDALPSDRQRALLRSLEAAAVLGLDGAQELATSLAARFCACDRLRQHAAQALRRPQSHRVKSRVERWTQAPWRCSSRAESEVCDERRKCLLTGSELCGNKDVEIWMLQQPIDDEPPLRSWPRRPRSATQVQSSQPRSESCQAKLLVSPLHVGDQQLRTPRHLAVPDRPPWRPPSPTGRLSPTEPT
eukprot:TRINITY_DN47908_c0_g1_i1.p1 TRINITY_DN47908_c0_g1~~TRINITY_DN47908_c0_g1_i1.p1  ORF type:complete len:344 (+),score=54.73 TRINITY_DN47908_c0_g1_i1:53-1084(+)